MTHSIFAGLVEIAIGIAVLYMYGYREGTARILSSLLLIIAVIMIFAGGSSIYDHISNAALHKLKPITAPMSNESLHTTI